jgi:hypothetical protein
MLLAIDLDYDTFRAIEEIDYVRAEWSLPHKFVAAEFSTAQTAPESVFRVRFLAA